MLANPSDYQDSITPDQLDTNRLQLPYSKIHKAIDVTVQSLRLVATVWS